MHNSAPTTPLHPPTPPDRTQPANRAQLDTIATRIERIATHSMRSIPWLICLIALLTRCWQLNYHSIWFDEAVSLQWAGSDAAFIWQKTFPLLEDKHPPLYYLGLHYWQLFMGWFGLAQSDGALRLLGALLGVVTVWAIMALARAVSGRSVALLTGLLVALSPVLVWYSQELRMFQPATTGGVIGAYALWRAWQAPTARAQWRWWLLFLVAMTAAFYTYLFSAFLMPAAGLTLLALPFITTHTDRWRCFVRGVIAMAGTALLYLPLVYNAWVVNGSEGDPGVAFADVGATLWRLLQIFTVWRVAWEAPLLLIALILFAGWLIAGMLLPQRKNYPSDPPTNFLVTRIWLLFWIGTPLLIGSLLQSRSASVFAEDRYFLFLTPFVLWGIAQGIVVSGQWLRGAQFIGGCVAVGLLLVALVPLWTPRLYRENWRAAADYITAYHAQSPSLPDTVVAHVDYTRLPLEWYLRQRYAFAELPLYHPYGGTLTPEEIDEVIAPPLAGILATDAATLWLTQSHLEGVDEARLVEGWLQERFPLVTELYPTGIKVSGFALRSQFERLPTLADTAQYPAVALAPNLELAACEVMTPVVGAKDEIMHPPSGWVHVRLWWRATGPIDDDYVATAEVIGAEGAWGVRLYRDNEALRRFPTSGWSPGQIVRDEVDINLNPISPARTYPVVIGLMDSSGRPTGNSATCGTVDVE